MLVVIVAGEPKVAKSAARQGGQARFCCCRDQQKSLQPPHAPVDSSEQVRGAVCGGSKRTDHTVPNAFLKSEQFQA
jgi:hypothetical protein